MRVSLFPSECVLCFHGVVAILIFYLNYCHVAQLTN